MKLNMRPNIKKYDIIEIKIGGGTILVNKESFFKDFC